MFTKKFEELDIKYDLKFGVVLTKSEFAEYSGRGKFEKVFVVKAFHGGLAHYLGSKFVKGGPSDGSKP